MRLSKMLNLSDWKYSDMYGWREWTLKIKGTNITVGHATSYSWEQPWRVSSRFSNIHGMVVEIDKNSNIDQIHEAWEGCFEAVEKKLLKDEYIETE